MRTMLPSTGKPRLSTADLERKLAVYKVDREKYPLIVVGIRGYYKDTMGKSGVNDRGIYDDAIFVHSPSVTAAFNANTDPSVYRPGHGTSEKTRGMACLQPAAYYVHSFDLHRGKYLALCQRLGPVTVMRDGNIQYRHLGNFGINIHRGGWNTTSSLGCQTIHPSQWDAFINLVTDQAKRYYGAKWRSSCVPYILIG